MKVLLALAVLGTAAWAGGQATPGVLIVQSTDKAAIVEVAKKVFEKTLPKPIPGSPPAQAGKFDAEKFASDLVLVPLVDIAAQEFDDEGRLTPVAWSMSDPVFRSAVDSRLIAPPQNAPSEALVREAMGKLRTGYLFEIAAFSEGGQIWTFARLLRGTREIWKDEVRTWPISLQSQFDDENARRSITRTWTQLLGGGPLKDMSSRKRIRVPESPAIPLPVPAAVPDRPATDNTQLLVEAMRLLSQKQFGEAVNLVRDAVDAEPLDPERRETLVSILLQAGEPALAADEARRAAQLMPERIQLWVSAARAWIAAENPAEALKDLNEAVVRDAEGAETRLLLGEVQIADGRFDLAAENLARACEKSPSAYGLRLLAFVHFIEGRGEAAAGSWGQADAIEVREPAPDGLRRFRLSQQAAFVRIGGLASEIRVFIQQARVSPKDESVRSALVGVVAKIDGLVAYFSNPIPEEHRNSADRLLLALNLLGQSSAGLRGAIDSPSEDALTDAAIDLGEALKALDAAKKVRREETAKG